MSNFHIVTDSGCDLPQSMIAGMNIRVQPLLVNFRGETLPDSVDAGVQEFYAGLRAGDVATTSAINPEGWKTVIEPVLQEGKDALVVTFSSGLSTTYQSAVIAADELLETYPERKIRVVDSRAASLGQGLLMYYICAKRDEGLSLDELADWTEENRLKLCHWFTVDDLMFLKRGGRVSAATALVGTMLQIKPILHVDEEGHLINMAKARGRKASILALAAKLKEAGMQNDVAYICHGDCVEDAQYLADYLKANCGVKEVFFGYTGAVIGSHSGPGTLALFYLGNNR